MPRVVMPQTLPEGAGAADVALRWAQHWAQRWFLDDDGHDRLRIGSIEAGWATHVEAYYLLHAFAQRHLGQDAGRASLASRLKASGHDRLIRAVGLRAMSSTSTARVVPGRIACILEIPTPSMSDGVIAVARAAGPDTAVLAADHRAMRRAGRAALRPAALQLSPTDQARLLRRAARASATGYGEVVRRPPVMDLDGDDVAEAALRALAPLVLRSVPWLVPEAAALEKALDSVRPVSVVLATDQHRIGRLAVSIARRRGIQSIAIQHGLPQARVGLVPVVADTVAVWSSESRDWFLSHDTDPGRVAVTGNPRWSGAAHGPSRATPTVVVALSPTDVEANRAAVRMAISAVERAPESMRLIVKLHPGHRDWGWVREEIGDRRSVRAVMHEPIEPLLEAAQVVIVLRSTVAMDALAAGTPVVLLRVPHGSSAADLELAGLGLPVASDSEQLGRELAALRGTAARDRYFADRSLALQAYLGPVGSGAATIAALAADGSSTRR